MLLLHRPAWDLISRPSFMKQTPAHNRSVQSEGGSFPRKQILVASFIPILFICCYMRKTILHSPIKQSLRHNPRARLDSDGSISRISSNHSNRRPYTTCSLQKSHTPAGLYFQSAHPANRACVPFTAPIWIDIHLL